MVFSRLINLFLYLVVGSVVNSLYAVWCNNSTDFIIYSSLSMTTVDTPLFAVSITLPLSFFSSCIALASFFAMFSLGGQMFFKINLISPLSSSAFPCFNCWHTLSVSDMYSLTGGSLVTTAKLGPQTRAFSCTSVRGVLERLQTHLTLLWFAVASDVTSDVTSEVSPGVVTSVPVDRYPPLPFWMFELPPVFFCHNQSNLFFCLSRVLKCLLSLL